MSIQGFTSILGSVETLFNSSKETTKKLFATLSRIGTHKSALDVAPRWLSVVATGGALDALPWTGARDIRRVLKITGHTLTQGQVIRFTSGAFIGVEAPIEKVITDYVFLGIDLPSDPAGGESFNTYRYASPTLDSSGNVAVVEGITTIVDFLDGGSFAPTGANAIPASSAAPLQIVAALAANVTRITWRSDIGEFVDIFDDAAGVNLIAHLPLTPDETIDIDIAAGTSIYIRAAKNVAIDQPGSIISASFIG